MESCSPIWTWRAAQSDALADGDEVVAEHERSFTYVGDIVSFYTETLTIGRTSVTISVKVEATRTHNREVVPVTEAVVTYVAVDRERNPIPVLEP